MEGPEELATASRIALGQLGGIEAAMGQVAATTAGDANLGEEV
jgi:hypothetical protein